MPHPLRDSLELIRLVRPEAGTAALEHEIAAERASSLGAAERRAVASLAALAANSEPDSRPALLAAAQKSVWEFMVQRELLGMRRHADIIRSLDIPPAVLNGLGVVRR